MKTDETAPSPAATAALDRANRIVSSLWIGPLSRLERLCIQSFMQQGHEYHLYVYAEPACVPSGTVVCDANEILPAAAVFQNRRGRGRGSFACFADLFRYKLLREQGGWWVDTDVFCLRPFQFDADYVFGAEDERIANGVIKVPPRSELMRRVYARACRVNHRRVVWNELGDVFSQAVAEMGLDRFVQLPCVFSPIHFSDIPAHVRGEKTFQVSSRSHAVHLFNEMWRRKKLRKNRRYGPGSVLEVLRHHVGLNDERSPCEDRQQFQPGVIGRIVSGLAKLRATAGSRRLPRRTGVKSGAQTAGPG